jgi:hypothetical protein
MREILVVLRRDGLGRVVRRLVSFLSPIPSALVARIRRPGCHEASQTLAPKYMLHPALGMTSPNEQAYFEYYARHIYQERGAIVDLGCWLGSTTFPLARGLRGGGKRGPVHAYDRFIWEEWMEHTTAGTLLTHPARGESFASQFRELAASWGDFIDVHEADLSVEEWRGGPIEFLLVDAMKSWPLGRAITRNFFPHVLTGGFILQQDFAHKDTPWVHLLNYRLADYLEPAYDVPASGSYVFRVVRPIPADLDLGFSGEDVDRAFELSRSITGREKHEEIAAAQHRALMDQGRIA